MKFFGIDPGASGGIACLTSEDEVGVTPLPTDEQSLWKWCQDWFNPIEDCRVVIEQVSGYIGGPGQPGSAMFNFGVGYGRLRMSLVAAGLVEGIHWSAVTPQVWQRWLGIVPRSKRGLHKESSAEFKRRLKEKAQKSFPDVIVTLKTSDALLIAQYCRSIYTMKSSATSSTSV